MDNDTLSKLNPWWRSRSGFLDDPSLAALERVPVRFDRSSEVAFEPAPDAIYTLRGPRQAGKTTILKQFLARLASQGVAPADLLYLSCEFETDVGLAKTLRSWLDDRRGPARRFIVLDEAADVVDWPLVLRQLWNYGYLRNTTLVVSGSHALDLRRATETLPGRRGEGGRPRHAPPLNQVLLPVSFREYALARIDGLREVAAAGGAPWMRAADLARSPAFGAAASDLLPFATDLHRAFREYLLCGGFPIPAQALAHTGSIPPEAYAAHVGAAGSDLTRYGLSEVSAAQIARRIVQVLSTPVSWNTLAATTDIRSHTTAKSYAEALEAAFLVYSIAPFDLSSKRPVDRRERKLYPSDPFVVHSLRQWGRPTPDPYRESVEFANDPARLGLLLEAAVASALARDSLPGIFSGLAVHHRLAYLKTRGGREVDFVVRDDDLYTPVEVKSSAASKVDRKAMSLVGPGVIVTLQETDRSSRPRVIEAPYFLFLLGPKARKRARPRRRAGKR